MLTKRGLLPRSRKAAEGESVSIESRLEQFTGEGAEAFPTLSVAQAAASGIKLHKSCLGNILCEPESTCSSVHFAKERVAFIGRHSYVNQGGYLRRSVFIGRYCSIGQRVSLAAAMHNMEGLSSSPALKAGRGDAYSEEDRLRLFGRLRPPRRQVTVIDNDVWVGDGAVILAGVRVGTGAVVAANSVVVRDVGPYEIVRGNPAVTVRRRFPDDVCDSLLESRWWNRPHAQLLRYPVGHVLAFLEALGREDAEPADDPLRLIVA